MMKVTFLNKRTGLGPRLIVGKRALAVLGLAAGTAWAGAPSSPNVLRDIDRLSWTPRAMVCANLTQALADVAVAAYLRTSPSSATAGGARTVALRYLKASGFFSVALPKSFVPRVLDAHMLEAGLLVNEAVTHGQLSDVEARRAADRCVTMANDLFEQGHLTGGEHLEGDRQAEKALRDRGPARHPGRVQPSGSLSFAFKEQPDSHPAPVGTNVGQPIAAASAFAVAPGYLVTSLRALAGAAQVEVLSPREKSVVSAEVVAQDVELDAALLKAKVSGPELTLAPAESDCWLAESSPTPLATIGFALTGQLTLEPREHLASEGVLPGAPVLDSRGRVVAHTREVTPVAESPVVARDEHVERDPARYGPALHTFLVRSGLKLKDSEAEGESQDVLRQAAPAVHLVVLRRR